jgi:hypothetical protein
MSFSESVSVNWDKNQFIGRGEPLYTYNNTERTGNLSFKLIMDYPSDYDCLKRSNEITNEIFASIAAGCHSHEGILKYLTECEIKDIIPPPQNNQTVVHKEEYNIPVIDKGRFYLFFPNDVDESYFTKYIAYESGLYDYVNKKVVDPFDENYIEASISGGKSYRDWKDEVKIQYTYKQQNSTVIDSDGDEFEMNKMNKPFNLSYDEITVEKSETKKRKEYVDGSNYGLNGNRADASENNVQLPSGDKEANGFVCKKPNCKYSGWADPQFLEDLAEYLKINYTVRLKIYGYASISGEDAYNKKLSERREVATKKFLLEKLKDVPNIGKRIDREPGTVGETAEWSKYDYLPQKCKEGSKDVWYLSCKLNRRVNIALIHDDKLLKPEHKPKVTPAAKPPAKTTKLSDSIIKRTYTECDHFKKLHEEDKFTFDKLKEKLMYFSPAFHSITPEGFNSRLTFLHQCTRQGNTNNVDRPNNLAFGRPPVCILRIGDFFYTKIIIDSLSIDYEPLVWDLNPEGVGVQPMIANVTLNFSFIGGSSLEGPIKQLQNALSFNYYANTGIFDGRAEKLNTKLTIQTEPPFIPQDVKIAPIDDYILDKEAIQKRAEDEDSIEKLELTAEFFKSNGSSVISDIEQKTEDGFNFVVKPLKKLNYEYDIKIYLVGKNLDDKDVKEDLGVTPNIFPAEKSSIKLKSAKINPTKAFNDITNDDRKLGKYKWVSVLENMKFEPEFTNEEINKNMSYIEGVSAFDFYEYSSVTPDGYKISYDVYKKIEEKDKDISDFICTSKKIDNKEYYDRIYSYKFIPNYSDVDSIVLAGRYTNFEFEVEFLRNGKSVKKVRRNYTWESEYKPNKLDVCKPKFREKVRTGNKEHWFGIGIMIQEVTKTSYYSGATYNDPSELLDEIDTYSDIIFDTTKLYEIGKTTYNSFIRDIEKRFFINKRIDDDMEPTLFNDKAYVISIVKIKGDTVYEEMPIPTYPDPEEDNLFIACFRKNDEFLTDLDNQGLLPQEKLMTYYLEVDEINEEDRVIYDRFNNGFKDSDTTLIIAEGKITPTIK